MGGRLGLVAALVLVLALERTAHAQHFDTAAAEALFEEGRKLMSAGKNDAACEKFAESERMAPSAGAALNLGVCLEKQGKIASAWAAFKEAAALSTQASQADREKFARERAEALAPRVPKVVVKVSATSDAELVVKRDGIAMSRAQWNTPIPTDPGKHSLEVSAPKKITAKKNFDIKGEGTTTEVAIPVLVDAPVVEPKKETTTIEDNGKALRIIGIGSAIVGAGLMVTGGLFASSAKSKENELSTFAAERGTWDPDRQTTYDDGEKAATFANVFLISGGVLLAAGGVLAVLGFTAKRSSTTTGLLVLPSAGGVRCAF